MPGSRSLVLLAALALVGCDEKHLIIESDTSWDGTVSYLGDIAGTGNADVDLSDVPSDVCWTIRKLTDEGSLRAYLADETWFGLGKETDGDQTTTEPTGVVRGCNQ